MWSIPVNPDAAEQAVEDLSDILAIQVDGQNRLTLLVNTAWVMLNVRG